MTEIRNLKFDIPIENLRNSGVHRIARGKGVFFIRRFVDKPLYFYINNTKIFSFSYLNLALNKKVFQNIKLDFKALDLFLTYNFIPEPFTIFKRIISVPLSCAAFLENQKILFYRLPYPLFSNKYDSIELLKVLKTEFHTKFNKLKEVNILLSGGIDSGIVFALAVESGLKINTFSMIMDSPGYSEELYQDALVNYFNSSHCKVKLNSQKFVNTIAECVQIIGLFGDVSFWAFFHFFKEINPAKNMYFLTGDGIDEFIGGYQRYIDFFKRYSHIFDEHFIEKEVLLEKGDLNSKGISLFKKYIRDYYELFNYEERKELYSAFLLKRVNLEKDGMTLINNIKDVVRTMCPKRFFSLLLALDIFNLLSANNIPKMSLNAEYFKIRIQSPYFFEKSCEYLIGLKQEQKFKNSKTKWVLKKLFEENLPDCILNRKKGMPTVPIGEWIKSDLKDYVKSILDSLAERNLFKKNYIKHLFEEHIKEKQNNTRKLRALLMLELFFKNIIDKYRINFEV